MSNVVRRYPLVLKRIYRHLFQRPFSVSPINEPHPLRTAAEPTHPGLERMQNLPLGRCTFSSRRTHRACRHLSVFSGPMRVACGGDCLLPSDHGRSDLARILERQNVLQTSQVLFRRICVSLAMVLPFKDSEGGTCSYSILIGVTSAGTRQ